MVTANIVEQVRELWSKGKPFDEIQEKTGLTRKIVNVILNHGKKLTAPKCAERVSKITEAMNPDEIEKIMVGLI